MQLDNSTNLSTIFYQGAEDDLQSQRAKEEALVSEIQELQREKGAMLASMAQKEAQRDVALREKDDAMKERDAAERRRDAAVKERDAATRERDGALGRLGQAEYEVRELRRSYEGLKTIGLGPQPCISNTVA